jgi:tagatose-1,6-bisphosphate aldolase non-catalytic subunit AgaZ/GatZ
MISEIATAQILEKDADETLRKALVAWHKKTGEKTYDKDLGVSVSTKLEYDEGQAIDWSRANAPILIVKTESLNKKGFEAIAADLDFVTKKDVPTARIGKSL